MADHLISASIFLRFLCPAILSPSLFGITREYPSEKAARNLTLIAKTLQTLANFTRFQGKENFMEFMNDFLEKEASTMKQFLKEISSPLSKDQCYAKFDDYIDVCKNLSILHTLFSESLTKVSANHNHSVQQRLDKLQRILDGISAHLSQPVTSIPVYSRQTSLPSSTSNVVTVNGHHRGADVVDRPNYQSLQRNVFRFNDPTVVSLSVTGNNNGVGSNGTSAPNGGHMTGNTLQLPVADGSTSPKASTLPRNAHLMTMSSNTSSSASNGLSAPGRRTAIDLTTNDDYVMFSALNQSADQSGNNSRPAVNHYSGSTFSVKNGLTKYERVLGLQPSSNGPKVASVSSASPTSSAPTAGPNTTTTNGNLEEFIDSLQYADESPDGAHSGGEGDNNTQGSQVSISQLSTVGSSGYQSFAYSQSSSPVDPTISSAQEVSSTGSGHSSSASSSFRQQGSAPSTSSTAGHIVQNHANNNVNNNVNGSNGQSTAIAFTNPIYNLRANKATTPIQPRSYASAYGYESVLNQTASDEDVSHHQQIAVGPAGGAPRVTLISSNGNHCSSSSPNNNSSVSSGTMSRQRMSSSSSESATPPYERRLFMSTAPRTNPRCVYPSPILSQQSQLLVHHPVSPVESGNINVLAATESQYAALRRKGRKHSTGTNTQNSRSRIYDSSSSSDSDFDPLPSARFRERNIKRDSRNGLDRCSNPKSLDEVFPGDPLTPFEYGLIASPFLFPAVREGDCGFAQRHGIVAIAAESGRAVVSARSHASGLGRQGA